MNKSKLGLTFFLMLLTISIGLVSVNLPLTSYAQNSALSQSGIGNDGVQKTDQSQSSEHDGQVVSGDSSVASGNNLLCQNQDNSEVGLGVCPDIEGGIPPESGSAPLNIKTVLRADCNRIDCPNPDGRVIVLVEDRPYVQYDPVTRMAGGTTERTFPIPIGAHYSIQAQGVNGGFFFSYELGNIQGDCSGRDRCKAFMAPDGANVIVNFHYCRGSC